MKHIGSLSRQFYVRDLQKQLEAHPEIWNEHRWRTNHPRSPHREADDIWVRYNHIDNLGPDFNMPHESVWYPVVEKIPAARELSEEMMQYVGGVKLGGVLITRISPGRQVYPHADHGWHAEHYEKFAILVQGNEGQAFCYEDGGLCCRAGSAFSFQNHVNHWVTNPTHEPRITLIICIRRIK